MASIETKTPPLKSRSLDNKNEFLVRPLLPRVRVAAVPLSERGTVCMRYNASYNVSIACTWRAYLVHVEVSLQVADFHESLQVVTLRVYADTTLFVS